MTRPPVVAVLGDLNVDVAFAVGEVPPPGGEVHAEATLTLGGSAALTARWLAALGCEVRLAAAVGDDPFGTWLKDRLAQDGVSSRWVQAAERPTGLCFSLVHPSGERTLLASPGACRELLWERFPDPWVDGADWVHLSGYAWVGGREREAAEQAVGAAQSRSIPVSLDPGAAAPSLMAAIPSLSAFELVLPNRREIGDLTGHGEARAGADELRRRGVPWVGVKLDRDGCFIAGPRGEAAVPSFPVRAGNTTGAGDAFNAGAIVGILSGWDPQRIGVLADLLGGAAALAGGGGALPDLRDLLSLLDGEGEAGALGLWIQDRWQRREQ